MELSDPPWSRREGLAGLVAALGDGASRVVGGAVRDALLGIDAADLDLATIHPPDETMRRLTAAGIRVVPTGLAHGTVTALIASGPVEVTTLRHDVATDGRHAVVAFTDDWQADAGRRDFTINALYADPATGALHDWFGGLPDLAARRVRFIGDPLARIVEDHLRILRFFRFHARFGDAVDADGLAACAARANDLMALSRERIAAELLKLLVAPGAVPVVALMIEHGILLPVLPEIADAAPLARLAAREVAAGVAPDAIRRLAVLVPADAAASVAARLKLSTADRGRLKSATGPLGDDGPRALAYRIGVEGAIDRLLLHGMDVAMLAGWTPPRLPIGGGVLVERGLRKGPAVAATLARIESRWIAEGFPDAVRAGTLADEEVAAALATPSGP
ncbi:CCA tRNA nucleotidyltransferase [uncultured Sphingomonas sp.]|uniref:CCA tRNA nucleotidyltransferase n=1 Tax=uncultured Sphingomonas sp. TaxID=158754 RepID=UPI0035CB25B3